VLELEVLALRRRKERAPADLNQSAVLREGELQLLREHSRQAECAQRTAERESQELYGRIEQLERRRGVGREKLAEMEALMRTCKQQINTLDQIGQMG